MRLLLFLRIFPDRAVDLLVERRTAGGELAKLIVLGAHKSGAITESAAYPFSIQSAVFDQPAGKIRLRQRSPADSHESDPAVPNIGRCRLKEEFLQVTVTASNHRQMRQRLLNLAGKSKVTDHAL